MLNMEIGVTEHDCAIFKRSLLDQKWLITMSSWGGVDDVDDVDDVELGRC
jgi:hypothetical protein